MDQRRHCYYSKIVEINHTEQRKWKITLSDSTTMFNKWAGVVLIALQSIAILWDFTIRIAILWNFAIRSAGIMFLCEITCIIVLTSFMYVIFKHKQIKNVSECNPVREK